MPRRNKRSRREAPPRLPSHGASLLGAREVPGPAWAHGEIFVVRQIPGPTAVKRYLCPGCNQTIEPGVAHVVAWPKEIWGGAEERRHWHHGCWARR